MNRLKLQILACTALFFSCGAPSEPEASVMELEMSPMDTIGQASGDGSYLFGDILSVQFAPDGSIMVLDGISCAVREYSSNGELLGEFAGKGSGPGQLLDPMDMAVLSDGRTAVADWGAWGMVFYDSTMSFLGNIAPMPGGSPVDIVPGADGSFTGLGLVFTGESGEYFLGSWRESIDEEFRFLQGEAQVRTSQEGEIEISFPTVVFDSDQEGNLYAALSTDSTFIVERFSPSGGLDQTIAENFQRIPVNEESAAVYAREAELLGEDPPEEMFSTIVADLYCDGESRLWVRMGTSPYPFFRVYDHRGDFLGTVTCRTLHDPLFELDFTFGGGRILAWNTDPEDYPKIIVMENPFSER